MEGCSGILEYSDETIRLTTGRMVLRFTGRGLSINGMAHGYAVVTGNIASIEFEMCIRDREEIYYRTDHHWTTDGAWYGYEAFAAAAGRQAVRPDSALRRKMCIRDRIFPA